MIKRLRQQGLFFVGESLILHLLQQEGKTFAHQRAGREAQRLQIPATYLQILDLQAGLLGQHLVHKLAQQVKGFGFTDHALAVEIRLLQSDQLPNGVLAVLAQPTAEQPLVRRKGRHMLCDQENHPFPQSGGGSQPHKQSIGLFSADLCVTVEVATAVFV